MGAGAAMATATRPARQVNSDVAVFMMMMPTMVMVINSDRVRGN